MASSLGQYAGRQEDVLRLFHHGPKRKIRAIGVFLRTGDGIRTEAHDSKKMVDPSLIIYAPVRRVDGKTIVTNGDQTDTIRDFLNEEKDLFRRTAHARI